MLLARRVGALASLLVSAWCFASAAHAADRVYWANAGGDPAPKISFANLDVTGGGNLSTSGAALDCCPGGAAIDAAAGRIYWGNDGADTISFARLDGTGGGDLITTGATVSAPDGVALDLAAGRIYWANRSGGGNRISFASLDGSGGGDLDTTGATVVGPQGIALDPAAGRVYWANNGDNTISFANVNGSGGGDLNTTGATVSSPWGVALDVAAGRIYWANNGATEGISFARLDASGGGDLTTTGATVDGPAGVAIDPAAGRIYWANRNGDKISFANLDGSGGGDLFTAGASVSAPNYTGLLQAPSGAGSPAITGATAQRSVLSCSQGSWAPDLPESFLARAPQSFAYQWSLDGADIAGASVSSQTATVAGVYRCTVTASNAAGSASQTSAAHPVVAAFGARTRVTLALAGGRIPARGPLKVRVSNANEFAITGRLSGQTTRKVTVVRKRRVKLKAKSFNLAAGAKRTVKLKLPKPLRTLLASKGKLSLRLTGKVTDPAGNTRTVRKKVAPKLKKKRKR